MILAGFTAASATNVLGGSEFEFIARPSRVSVGVVGDSALNAGNLFTFQIGEVVIGRNVQVFSSTGVDVLRWPTHFLIQNEPALPGQRMILRVDRAAGNILWAVNITEVV